MKFYLFFIFSCCLLFLGCQGERHYDEHLTGHLPNSAETEWIYSTTDNFSDEKYLKGDVRKPDLILVDSTIVYTTKNQKIVALDARKGTLLWHTANHTKKILSLRADSTAVYCLYIPDKDNLMLVALDLKTGAPKWTQHFDTLYIPSKPRRGLPKSYYGNMDTLNILSFQGENILLCLAENESYFNQSTPYTVRIDKTTGKILAKNKLQFQYRSSLPSGNNYLPKTYMMVDYKKSKAYMYGRIVKQELYINKKDTALVYHAPSVNPNYFVYDEGRSIIGYDFKENTHWIYASEATVWPWVNIHLKDSLAIIPLDYVCMGNPCYSRLTIFNLRTGKPVVDKQLLGYSHPNTAALLNNKYYIALDPEPVSVEAKADSYILEVEIPSGKYLRIFRTNRSQIIQQFTIKGSRLILLNGHGEVISMKLLN